MRPLALLLVVLSAALAVAGSAARCHSGNGDTLDPRHLFGTAPGSSTTSSAGCCCRATSATCAACATRRRRSTWNMSFSGGRSLAARRGGDREGSRDRHRGADSCDDVAEELPPDAPADWLHTLSCNDPLLVKRAGRATGRTACSGCRGRPSRSRRRRSAPPPCAARSSTRGSLFPSPACWSSREGRSYGSPSAPPSRDRHLSPAGYCLHIAKPYDGYRSFDECVDTLQWSGTITITRL